jgi:hypothetical protein
MFAQTRRILSTLATCVLIALGLTSASTVSARDEATPAQRG